MTLAVLGQPAFADLKGDGERYELIVGVRHAIEMECREGEWRMLTTHPIIDWTRTQNAAGIGEQGFVQGMTGRGGRDAKDGSYFAVQ